MFHAQNFLYTCFIDWMIMMEQFRAVFSPNVDPHSLLVLGMAVSEYGGTIWTYWLGNQFAYHAMIMQYINKD